MVFGDGREDQVFDVAGLGVHGWEMGHCEFVSVDWFDEKGGHWTG